MTRVNVQTSKNTTMYSDGVAYWRKDYNPHTDSSQVHKVQWENKEKGFIQEGQSRQIFSRENLEILFEEQFRIHHIKEKVIS